MNETIKRLQEERDRLHKELTNSITLLISGLEYAKSRLEDKNDGRINGLGFFQGQAAGFDILCAKYEMTKWHLEIAEREQYKETVA